MTIEDAHYELFDRRQEVLQDVLTDFINRGKKKTQSFKPLKLEPILKIWNDFAKMGFVRNEKGLDAISDEVIYTALKILVNSYLVGHTSDSPEEDLKDYGIKYRLKTKEINYSEKYEQLCDYIEEFSDYAQQPLYEACINILTAKDYEWKLIWIDWMFNIVHCRSILSELFIEGGNDSLNILGGYVDSESKVKEAA